MNLTRENLLKVYRVVTALDAIQGNKENFAYAELVDEALDILAKAFIEEVKKRKIIKVSKPMTNPNINFTNEKCEHCGKELLRKIKPPYYVDGNDVISGGAIVCYYCGGELKTRIPNEG